MLRSLSKRSLLKSSLVLFSVIAFGVVISTEGVKLSKVSASASGPTPSHTNAPGETNCTACHSDFQVNSGSSVSANKVIFSGEVQNLHVLGGNTDLQVNELIVGAGFVEIEIEHHVLAVQVRPQGREADVPTVRGVAGEFSGAAGIG